MGWVGDGVDGVGDGCRVRGEKSTEKFWVWASAQYSINFFFPEREKRIFEEKSRIFFWRPFYHRRVEFSVNCLHKTTDGNSFEFFFSAFCEKIYLAKV